MHNASCIVCNLYLYTYKLYCFWNKVLLFHCNCFDFLVARLLKCLPHISSHGIILFRNEFPIFSDILEYLSIAKKYCISLRISFLFSRILWFFFKFACIFYSKWIAFSIFLINVVRFKHEKYFMRK